MTRNPEVDAYVAQAERWPEEIAAVRPILTGCGLVEEIKWNKPCFTHDGHNIVILQEMKDFLALMFFKGALLADEHGVLEDQGPNSRSARRMCITSVDDVTRLAPIIAGYVAEAIEVEQSGRQIDPAPELVLADELQARLDADPALRDAFESLTPGRRREYNLHISGAKQAGTRASRVDRCVPSILDGKGLRGPLRRRSARAGAVGNGQLAHSTNAHNAEISFISSTSLALVSSSSSVHTR